MILIRPLKQTKTTLFKDAHPIDTHYEGFNVFKMHKSIIVPGKTQHLKEGNTVSKEGFDRRRKV